MSQCLSGSKLSQHVSKTFSNSFPRLSSLPPTWILVDENVQFSSKLHDAGVDVRMEIVPGMPHGFLAFGQTSTECQLGVDHVTKKIGDLIKKLDEVARAPDVTKNNQPIL